MEQSMGPFLDHTTPVQNVTLQLPPATGSYTVLSPCGTAIT
jgi:hypothetical protein